MQLTDTAIAILLLATVVAAFVLLLVVSMSRARGRFRKAGETARALGFVPVRAGTPGAHHHWRSADGERPALIGYYSGSREVAGTGGLLLMVHTGAFVGATRGVDLSARPPRLTGREVGTPDATPLGAALSRAVVEAADGLDEVILAPGEGLIPGALLHTIVNDAWPGGWKGLHIRAVIPLEADEETMRATMAQLERLAEALVRADPAP